MFYILGIGEDTFYIILMLSRKQVAFTVICTIYLFIKWINELELKKIYLYGFLLGLLTLFIMRLVCSISLNEIKDAYELLLSGKAVGRYVVKIRK